jgi:hypothetical protein
MSVTNKTIRELEDAAVEAVQAMNELAELLDGGASAFLRDQRIANRVERLRIASAELDRAETNCARERICAMSEADMREEFAALGLDWDETTNRGHALLQKLLAEYDAGKSRVGASGFSLPDESVLREEDEQAFGTHPEPSGITGAVYQVERLDEDRLALCTDMMVAEAGRRLIVDDQALEAGEASRCARRPAPEIAPEPKLPMHDIPPSIAKTRVVRLDDSDITRLLAEQIAEEFGVDLRRLENIPRDTLLRLHAELDRARRLRLPRAALAPQILDIIGHQPGGSVGERLAELAVRPGHAVREPGESAAEYVSRLQAAYVGADESTTNIWATKRAEPQLLDLPLGHQPGGLGDGGKSETEAYNEAVRSLMPSDAAGIQRFRQITEARKLLKANGWSEGEPGEWSPATSETWAIDVNREACSPAILRALAILAEEAQS